MADYYERKQQLIELSSADDSDSYSIDENGIYYDPRTETFIWLSASGCSCWDGDYSETSYDSLDEALDSMLTYETRWHPATSETTSMIEEAKFVWNDIKDRLPDLMEEFELANPTTCEDGSDDY